MRLPWVKLKVWSGVLARRTRRDWKMKLALARLSGLGAAGGLFGGGGGGDAESELISDEERTATAASLGFSVAKVKRD